MKERTVICSVCFNIGLNELCSICADQKRDPSILCVVEDPRDVIAVEKANSFRGRYHVLGGALSPIEGVGTEQLHIRELLERVERDAHRRGHRLHQSQPRR